MLGGFSGAEKPCRAQDGFLGDTSATHEQKQFDELDSSIHHMRPHDSAFPSPLGAAEHCSPGRECRRGLFEAEGRVPQPPYRARSAGQPQAGGTGSGFFGDFLVHTRKSPARRAGPAREHIERRRFNCSVDTLCLKLNGKAQTGCFLTNFMRRMGLRPIRLTRKRSRPPDRRGGTSNGCAAIRRGSCFL